VQIARVMGSLAVSRSLGDVGFKKRKESLFPGRLFSDNLISAEPEVFLLLFSFVCSETKPKNKIAHVRLERETLLVLACDGLWDVLTAEKVSFCFWLLLLFVFVLFFVSVSVVRCLRLLMRR
jgi:serine/threonine protein phosphatase PrpC